MIGIAVESDRSPFGGKGLAKLMSFHARLSGARKRSRACVTKLPRRLFQQRNLVPLLPDRDPLQRAAFWCHMTNDGSLAIHRQVVFDIVRMNRNEGNRITALDPVDAGTDDAALPATQM